MDGLRLSGHGKELPKDDGLSRSLGSGSNPQWIEVCHPTGGGVVTWARTAALNFQLQSVHPRAGDDRDGLVVMDLIMRKSSRIGNSIGAAFLTAASTTS